MQISFGCGKLVSSTMTDVSKVPWFIDDVIDRFLELLHRHLYDVYVWEDETQQLALNAIEGVRGCSDNETANNMYDRGGVQLCWVVGGELRVKYVAAACAVDMRRVVSEDIDIAAFLQAWPGWCDDLIEAFIPGSEY